MIRFFKKLFNKFLKKEELKRNINEISLEEYNKLSYDNKISIIENEIHSATLDGNSSIDVKFSLPQEIIDDLCNKGYNISQHTVYDYTKCDDYMEAPGIAMFMGNPKEEIWTKIYW